MAIIKHISVKNRFYSDAVEYLTCKFDEYTNKPILDEKGRVQERDSYLIEGVNCNADTFGAECIETNRLYGKNNSIISDTPYSPTSIYNGKLYFSDPNGRHHILSMDTKTCQIVNYYDSNSYLTLIDNNYAYYIDLDKQYSLVRLNMSNKTLELLYAPENGKVINYNVYGNKIFFHVEGGDNAGLYRMNVDGTQLEYVAVGEISGIHCTSRYTFFSYYEDQSTLYRIPTTAPITTIEEISIN